MGCGCQACKKTRCTKRRKPTVSAGIMYLLGKTKVPKKKPSMMKKPKRRVQRKKRGGKFLKNKKVTKIPRRRVKIVGKKRKR